MYLNYRYGLLTLEIPIFYHKNTKNGMERVYKRIQMRDHKKTENSTISMDIKTSCD